VLTPDRWAHVKELFHDALECAPARRQAFLCDACAGDESLRQAVESLLALEPKARGFLESRAIDLAVLPAGRDRDDGPPGPPLPRPERAAPGDGLSAERGPAAPRSPHLELMPRARRPPAKPSRPPWWLVLLAALFLFDCLLRIYCFDLGPEGFGFLWRAEGERHIVAVVEPGSLAQEAGVRVGDEIVAHDGVPLDWALHRRPHGANLEVGRSYRLVLERDGRQSEISIRMRRAQVLPPGERAVRLLWQLANVLTLATAILIAFKRPHDPIALMGALTLASLSVGLYFLNFPPGYASAWRSLPLGLGTLLWIPNLCIALMGPIGLTFFASFPRPLFRTRWPWGLIWLPSLVLLPIGIASVYPVVYEPDWAGHVALQDLLGRIHVIAFGVYGLAMLAVTTTNYVRLTDDNERGRLRVLLVGGTFGTFPALVRLFVIGLAPGSALYGTMMSPAFDILIASTFLAFPVSFGYAVLRHQLLGITVMLRQGLQYALARGVVLSLLPALAVVLFVDLVAHGDEPLLVFVRRRALDYLLLGAAAVIVVTQRRRWSEAIDRRFFRERYDARRLMRAIADSARTAGGFQRAAPAVVAHVEAALHPEFAAAMVRSPGESRLNVVASAPAGRAPGAIAADWRASLGLIDERGTPRTISLLAEARRLRVPENEIAQIDDSGIDLLVPLRSGADGWPLAALALGPKRSGVRYSRDDLELLDAVASNLALLFEAPERTPAPFSRSFEECPRCGACYDSDASNCTLDRSSLVPVGMSRTLAGRYRLDRRLGRGGMGTVYEALDGALQRRVAVKLIRDEWVNSAAAASRFAREARIVAGLTHPNVVSVFDYGVEAGARAFLVMELLQGGTLREEIQRAGRLEAARVLAILRGVCGAVEAAHLRQLVHRDLKPDNVFLVSDGGSAHLDVKVLDFGVAKPLSAQDEPPGALPPGDTEVGVLVGTVGYMSPEQVLGEPPSVTWDVWALAVVAYEALAGALPFPVPSREAWRQSVLAGRPTPLDAHQPDAPPAWMDFFARALNLDRRQRPGSAGQFFVEFARALGAS
jgi:tRNA A-37 threonylcarbamoyl transferase component Bud32